ncbi:response regulator [Rhodocytophaga rosea]|nr:response regulator [Rhodocytophaga rosea]
MTTHYPFKNILLVDDDEISTLISSTLLKHAKLATQIQSVYNGKEAIEYLTKECSENKFCPSLLFLDLNMPVMDGFEFLEAYTHNERLSQMDLSIVVLTSSAHSKDKEKVSQYPIKGFITKPITPEKIQAIFS